MDTRETITGATTSLINVIISSVYGGAVRESLKESWKGYLINFMFKSLRGSRASVIRQMEREVERVYATILTRVVREPRKHPTSELPLWIVCPDFPVPTHSKKTSGKVTINAGCTLTETHCAARNRMNCGLDEHFEICQEL